jgi:putative aldouronate transport system permease protein
MTTPSGPSAKAAARRPDRVARPPLLARLWSDRIMLLLVLPGLVYFIVFQYLPLIGYNIAFKDYSPFLGVMESPWVGLDNFRAMLGDHRFWQAVYNTLAITFLQLVFFFPAPIALALILNSLISPWVRRIVQTTVYMPHFLSWVIVVSIFQQLFGGGGVLNQLLRMEGFDPINVMNAPELFKAMVTSQLIWKETGWGTIIYLAALLSIDNSLYESAAVDGANARQRLWHVTLPGILGVTLLLLILRLGTTLTVGFEQILLQRDAVGPEAAEVLDTYVYYQGIVGGAWGVTAAAGLIKGLFGTAMVIGANKLAHYFGQPGIYR